MGQCVWKCCGGAVSLKEPGSYNSGFLSKDSKHSGISYLEGFGTLRRCGPFQKTQSHFAPSVLPTYHSVLPSKLHVFWHDFWSLHRLDTSLSEVFRECFVIR